MSIRIGTNERGGTFFTEGETLAKVLREKTNLAPVKVYPVLSASVGGIKGLEIMTSNLLFRRLTGLVEPSEVKTRSKNLYRCGW